MAQNLTAKQTAPIILSSVGIMIAAMDIFLPALPHLRTLFQTSEWTMQFSLTLYSVTAALTGFIFGRSSDLYGRRPIILISFVLLTVGSLLCAQATSIHTFLGARFLQSLGGSGISVVGISMLADLFKGVEFARYMAIFGILYPVTYAVAPNIGAYFLTYHDWSWSFYFVAILSTLVFFVFYYVVPEPSDRTQHQNETFFSGLKTFRLIFVQPYFQIMCLAHALPVALSVVYTSNAPFLFIDLHHVSPIIFAQLNLIPVCVNVITTLIYRAVLPNCGLNRALRFGAYVNMTFVVVTLLVHLCIGINQIWIFLSLSALLNIGLPWCLVSAGSLVTQASGIHVGTGMAYLSLMRNGMMSVGVMASGYFYNYSATPTFMFLMVIASLIAFLIHMGLKMNMKTET